MKTFATDQFRTALDMGNETGLQIYEWKPDSLEEHLLTEAAPVKNDLIGMDFDRSKKEDIERVSFLKLFSQPSSSHLHNSFISVTCRYA